MGGVVLVLLVLVVAIIVLLVVCRRRQNEDQTYLKPGKDKRLDIRHIWCYVEAHVHEWVGVWVFVCIVV